ncbi:glycerophosphodiester phosphodiesterase [Ruania alba]|uniref:Glycerophosphoryl diester phosphodiesterase n=1 Tax=Ruania alba TaxID=648782 RepID=A0A1H5M0B3_9MICO|nr:glycerophosphodiester phosphodiesterase family protein [Ruania alba]SEE82805.1 glycerophosphoryl diester phosphodiesterase [Ruania alba]
MPCFIVGHRGAADLAPENTLAAMAAAVQVGTHELETDLRLSRDGEIVIMHDETVDRTTDGHGTVNDLTLAELRELDAGNGEQVPTFAEVLDATSIPLQIEIKDPTVIEPLLELLRTRPGDVDRLRPTSFERDSVQRMAAGLPQATVGLISKASPTSLLDEAADLGARRVLVGYEAVTEAFIETAHARGFRVDLWPITTPEQVRRTVDLGADGFTTDDPRIVGAAGYAVTPHGLVDIGASERGA